MYAFVGGCLRAQENLRVLSEILCYGPYDTSYLLSRMTLISKPTRYFRIKRRQTVYPRENSLGVSTEVAPA